MQYTVFQKLKVGAEKNAAGAAMYHAGPTHLKGVIKERDQKGKTNTTYLNTNSACIVE